MVKASRQELYRSFMEFVRTEVQRERSAVNRRMFSVLLWCFVFPALLAVLLLILVRAGVLPARFRSYLDLIVLIFPVSYSIYFLGAEVLRDAPSVFKRGGVANTLTHCVKEGEWRERMIEGMRRNVNASQEDWKWIVQSFETDLEALQYRTRYLTALAGAVFFLIMQGIDSLSEGPDERKVSWVKDSLLGWIEVGGADPTQFVGLGLFLVLFYLSGSQTYHALKRYLSCAELAARD